MTSIFTEGGKHIACTLVEAGPCVVTQVKNEEADGYYALQLGFQEKKAKNTPKPMQGHFEKAGTTPKRKLIEFRDCDLEKGIGDTVTVEDVFVEGDKVHAIGRTKGKGFQGVVKRYNFKGVGDATHGQHNRQRAPGSIGQASYPAQVRKGMRMGGRMGGVRVKVKNLEIVKIYPEKNLIVVSGAIPGHNGSTIIIEKR